MLDKRDTLERVQDYYSRVLKGSADLKTTACCVAEKLPAPIAAIVEQIHPEVRQRFYGCGVLYPSPLEGKTVLDLGCGSGRDVYLLSKLVGESGKVIGVDMTPDQLQVAKKHRDFHAKAFGYKQSNVTLLHGFIEDLASVDIASESIDIVVSNCVINLSPAKEEVFSEIFRVLKPGGELYFSDVFADRRLSAEIAQDPVLLGECLGGAMYTEDFRRLMAKVGCSDVRTLARSPIDMTNAEVARMVGMAQFVSLTLRAFKLDLEDRCEDYGQVATYLGTLDDHPSHYRLDDHHDFEAHRPMTVCSNTAKMLTETRFSAHFRVEGTLQRHFGLFPCGPAPVKEGSANPAACC